MSDLDSLLAIVGKSNDADARRALQSILRMVTPPKDAIPKSASGASNDRLDDIRKTAKQLTSLLTHLRLDPHAHLGFWLDKRFGPVHMASDQKGFERGRVFETLAAIEGCASAARNSFRSRPVSLRKQRAIDAACSFFLRYVGKPSTPPTSAFHTFARAFYSVVSGKDEDVTRQVRAAVQKAKARAGTELPE